MGHCEFVLKEHLPMYVCLAAGIGPGPPLFEASVPYVHGLASHGSQNLSASFRTAPSGSFRSFRQRSRASSESFRSEQAAPGRFAPDNQQVLEPVPLHTSDGVIPGTAAPVISGPIAEEPNAPQRSFFRSPFADWNPATGLANDTTDSSRASVEMTRAQSNSRA